MNISKQTIIAIYILLFYFTPFLQVNAQDLTTLKYTVEDADDWNNLFLRNSGWFGGDGIFTLPLGGKETYSSANRKTLFIFSDTMVGQIKDNKLEQGSKMTHNSAAILDGNLPDPRKLNFFYEPSSEGAESLFIPKTPNTKQGDYYWLGDGFVNTELSNSIFIFGYRVRTTSQATFGFAEVGNTMIKIANKAPLNLNDYTQKDTPFFLSEADGEMGSFGAGIYVNTKAGGAGNPDGYIYIYGTQGKTKKLLVARVLPKQFEEFSKWNFWDGQQWQSDIKRCAAVTDQVSNELSLSQLPDGRFILVFQEAGMGKHVAIRLAKTPVGPFGPIIRIWDTSSALELKTFFSYNAKAHPSLSKKGELLISYNVNSFDFFKDIVHHPHLYRPRFIRLKLP
ncbi:MAG: DUF4185 domain-containing protein [Bacteroidota bacterium]